MTVRRQRLFLLILYIPLSLSLHEALFISFVFSYPGDICPQVD